MKLVPLLFCTFCASVCFAQTNITLLDGTTLERAKIIRKKDAALVFSHSRGIATIRANELPDDLLAIYFPEIIAQPAVEESITPKIHKFLELSDEQQSDVISGLKERYLFVHDVGLLEIFTASGSRSLSASLLGYRYISDSVSQTLRDDEYFIAGNSLKLTVPGNDQLVDGSYISGLAVEDGTYDYTTIQGASRRVRAYRMVDTTKPTIDDFVAAMKTNQIFTAVMMDNATCSSCSGKGYTYKSTTSQAGMTFCSRCAGKGSIERRSKIERDPDKTYRGDGVLYDTTYEPCTSCGGTGKKAAYATTQVKTPCNMCDSKGTQLKKVEVEVGW